MKRVLLIASLLVVSSNAFAASTKACVAARQQARADYLQMIALVDQVVDSGKISISAGKRYKDNAAHILAQAEDFCALDAEIVH